MERSKQAVSEALMTLGVPVTPDTVEQLLVFSRSMDLYVEREKQYGETWKQFGAGDKVHHCEHKVARMKATVTPVPQPTNDGEAERIIRSAGIDSALDVINYAGFYIRHLEGNDGANV
jgi:hypothetical protein